MANGTTSNGKGEKKYDFTPIDCDTNNIEPDAAVGEYEAKVDSTRVMATKKDNMPMLVIDWKLEKTESDDEACEKSIGATVADFIALFPDGDRRGRMGKLRLRQLREAMGIDDDVLPSRITSKDDFKDLQAAMRGQKLTVWVTHKTDTETNEVRIGIQYAAPKGSMGAIGRDNDDEQEEDAPRRASASKSKSKSARR
jgi:hypothetical protein